MACGCCKKKKKGESDVFKPRSKRWCTDVLCLALFCAAMGSVAAIGYACVSVRPELLYSFVYPADSFGNYCGKPGSAVADFKKVFYPDLDRDIVTHGYLISGQQYATFFQRITKLCAGDCPDGVSLSAPSVYGGASYPRNDDNSSTVPEWFYTFTTQEVASRCFPLTSTYVTESQELCVTPPCTDATLNASLGGALSCAVIESRPDEMSTWEICPSSEASSGVTDCTARAAACEYSVTRSSSDTFLPADYDVSSTSLTKEIARYVEAVVAAADAVITAWQQLLLFGLGAPIVLGFLWCIFLWFFAGVVVYTTLALGVLFLLALSLYLSHKAGWLSSVDFASAELGVVSLNSTLLGEVDSDNVWYPILAVVSLALSVLSIVLICAWAKCIARCIAIVRECTKVFRTLPAIMVWPLIGVFAQLLLLGCGLLLLWWTLDDEVWVEIEDEYGFEVGVDQQVGVAIYVIFVTLWAVNLAKAVSWTSMSSAVSYWFVTDNAPAASGHRCCQAGTGVSRLADATWTVVSKHLGSMAVGSALIAACQTVRLVLYAVDGSTKKAQEKNFLLKLTIKCVQCALWCLQKSVEFVSFYAYCFVALEGTSFCRAAKDTFMLCRRYPSQLAVNKIVAKLLSLLIGLSTPCACTVFCFLYLDADAEFSAHLSPFYPAAAVFLAAYLVADGITTVFTCCVDTIYLSAFKDMDENDPPRFMSNDLRRGFGLDAAASEAPRGYGTGKRAAAYNKVAPEPSETPVEPYDGKGE